MNEAAQQSVVDRLEKEHMARQLQRFKTAAPIKLVTFVLLVVGILTGVLAFRIGSPVGGILVGGLFIVAAILWGFSAQLLAEWDRAVILRWGRFHRVEGPGLFMITPIIDSVARLVDMRVRTTTFSDESTLTRDTVPVMLDAIAFWHIWDAQKALMEVEVYYEAISLAVQTALRDVIGVHSLAEILAERDKMGETLQHVLQAKTESWGISVTAIEIRDIEIPEALKDALSKQAQAERERQARTILGEAEIEIASKFARAAHAYADNPVALQLRAMNIVYEGIRAGGSLMLVPSSVLDTMNLGGLAALGQATRPPARTEPQTD